MYTLYEFAVAYLDHAKARHAEKTYLEKRIAFQQLFKAVDPHLAADRLHKGQVLTHFEQQAQARSGNAANKDRKNLLAAWTWAGQYLPSFPQENPFKVLKCAEQRSPRYVPPEKDFWAVYDVAESEQDRYTLLKTSLMPAKVLACPGRQPAILPKSPTAFGQSGNRAAVMAHRRRWCSHSSTSTITCGRCRTPFPNAISGPLCIPASAVVPKAGFR